MSKRFITLGLAGLAFVVSGAAGAVQYDLDSTFGPLHLDIDANTFQVHGTYPKFGGEIFAEAKATNIDGIWTQPKSDHPCKEAKHGTVNWGRVNFPAPQDNEIKGAWGYCDADPTEPWNAKILK